jgi:hypothetical protein
MAERPVLIPGVAIETLQNPARYAEWQIEQACAIAHALQRGKLIICIPPAR